MVELLRLLHHGDGLRCTGYYTTVMVEFHRLLHHGDRSSCTSYNISVICMVMLLAFSFAYLCYAGRLYDNYLLPLGPVLRQFH